MPASVCTLNQSIRDAIRWNVENGWPGWEWKDVGMPIVNMIEGRRFEASQHPTGYRRLVIDWTKARI